MTIGNYVMAVGFALGMGITGYSFGRLSEGHARCRKDGLEEHFARDFPGYNPDSDFSDVKDQKLDELREVYLSGGILYNAEHITPAEQVDTIQKSHKAKRVVGDSCQRNNQSY